MIFVGLLLFLLLLMIEGSYIALPMVVPFLIVFLVIYRSGWILILALFAGILLDVFLFREIGKSATYLLGLLLLVLLYEKRFEVRTVPFIVLATGVGTLGYLIFFGHRSLRVQEVCAIIFSVLFYILFQMGQKREEKGFR